MRPHELETKLKTLRLGGMLQTLDVRRTQAEAERLGHVEFLALLLDDEIDRRQTEMLAQRLHRARFEEPKTLEDFDFHLQPPDPCRAAAQPGHLQLRRAWQWESVWAAAWRGALAARRSVRRWASLAGCVRLGHAHHRRRGLRPRRR